MDFKVTPWEVEGEVDYNKLIEQFGTQPLTQELLAEFEKKAGELHLFLKRRIFFSHRDFDWILRIHHKEPFALYTGRGPTGPVHLGHLMPWIFCKYLQDKFNSNFYFQVTDDEKFLFREELSVEDTKEIAYDNILDIIACGFDSKKTFIFIDTEYAKTLYNIAITVAKRVTFSTTRAVFGFENSTNIGMIFFPAIQAVPCFLPSILEKRKAPVLIPAAIDQDNYWRVTRDVAERLGFYKPAAIHNIFLPSLTGPSGKMSASKEETAIFCKDTREQVFTKVMNAFTGGRATIAEQRTLGGNPDICTIYQYYYFLFMPDDDDVEKRHLDCKSGNIMCGPCKAELAERIWAFLEKHQERREKAKDVLEKFMLRD
jgi:tryptophanyl-tRNA synthetase